MKELLRIAHAEGDRDAGSLLRDYNMEIDEGEILYIQGSDGSGIREIAGILSGDLRLYGGQIYIDGQRTEEYSRNIAFEKHFFPVSADGSMIYNLTVAENMEVLRSRCIFLKPYNSKRIEKSVDYFLQERGIKISADARGSLLCTEEEVILSLLKAKLHGARLVILEVLNGVFEGTYAGEICSLLKELCSEGISFIVLSSAYSHFAEIAARIQFVYRGRDLKEWNKLNGEVIKLLKNQNPDTFSGRNKSLDEEEAAVKGNFLGIYDYEWTNDKSIWDFLKEVQMYNTSVWKERFNVLLPDRGIGIDQDVLVIPKESGNLWFDNMSIEDNLLMPIPEKIAGSRYGIIRRNRKEHVLSRFYDLFHIEKKIKEIEALSKVQRKLFSIYRFELCRPKTIFLENPYWGMDQDEIMQVRKYLINIQKSGCRIICCSKSIDEMKADCNVVIQTDNAKNARVIHI